FPLGAQIPSADQSRGHDGHLQPAFSQPGAHVRDAGDRLEGWPTDVRRQAGRDRRAALQRDLRRRGRRGRDRVAAAMATTIGTPTPGPAPPPTSPGSYDGLRSARAALTRPESARARILRLVVLLIAVVVLVRGWMVTEID